MWSRRRLERGVPLCPDFKRLHSRLVIYIVEIVVDRTVEPFPFLELGIQLQVDVLGIVVLHWILRQDSK